MMTTTKTSRNAGLCAVLLAAALPASAIAQNGLFSSPRVFNDFTTSTLLINNSNSIPGTVSIDDRNMTDDGIGGNFANRHDVMLSGDGGATALSLPTAHGFTIQANVTLAVGSNSPRKEAGFRVNSPVSGDALFLINSDAGEIVAFGGGAPFKIFGSNGGGNGYTPGSPILMGMTYTPGSPKGTVEYFINRGSGIETSGPLFWDNLEGGPVNYSVAMYTQVSPADGNDFVTATFNNVTASVVVPEPASLAALSLGGLAMVARRRRA